MSAISLMVLVLVSIMVVEKAASCYPPYGRTNGCSIPFDLPYFYKQTFRPDCNKHDICYGCGARFGLKRSHCDYVFYQNMLRSCKRNLFCRIVAEKYYRGVQVGGSSFYANPSDYWCIESWVRSCL